MILINLISGFFLDFISSIIDPAKPTPLEYDDLA